MTDSLRNNGIPYTEYIGDKGFDVAYCEALISTGKADKAIDEIKQHVATISSKMFMPFILLELLTVQFGIH